MGEHSAEVLDENFTPLQATSSPAREAAERRQSATAELLSGKAPLAVSPPQPSPQPANQLLTPTQLMQATRSTLPRSASEVGDPAISGLKLLRHEATLTISFQLLCRLHDEVHMRPVPLASWLLRCPYDCREFLTLLRS